MNSRFHRKVESFFPLNCKPDKRNKKRQKNLFLVFLVLLPILLCFQFPNLLSAQSLNDPFSYALFGNSGKMKIMEDVTISGNIFHNGEVKVKENAQVIDGQLYATGDVIIKEGAQVVQGELPDPQPQFPQINTSEYDNLLNQAHNQPKEDKKFENINLDGETLFIHGKMVLKDGGSVSGPGMIVVDGAIRINEASIIGSGVTLVCSERLRIKENTTMEQGVLFSNKEIQVNEGCNIAATIRSLNKVRIKENVSFNGLIHTRDRVKIKEGSDINGIIIAGKEIVIQRNAVITYDPSVISSCQDDTTPPIIAITSPLNSETINTTTPQITIEFSDDVCGIDPNSFAAQINNVESSALFTVSEVDATYQVTTALPEGVNIITASINDLNGNSANTSATFTVEIPSPCDSDTTPPVINITSPIDGETINTTTPQITIEFSDDICGIDPNSFAAQINSVESQALFTVTEAGATYQVTTDLPEGANVITASVSDLNGNSANTSATFTIELPSPCDSDTTPPVINITSPINGETITTTTPQITIEFNDDVCGIDPNSFTAQINSVESSALFTVTGTGATYQTTTDLPEGVNVITASVSDLGGNSANTSATFTIETSPPGNNTPTIGSIGDRSVDVGGTLSFAVTSSDPNNDDIDLMVIPIPLPDNTTFNCGTGLFTFTPDITQAGASFNLTFIASDGSLTDSEEITITVNDLPITGTTSLQGQILDANDAENGITTPIVGTIVRNTETGLFSTTNSSGNFTLSGLSDGVNHFEYDGTSVNAPDSSLYGSYVGMKEIIANVANVIVRPVYLMRVDTTGEAQVDPTSTTVINNTNLNVTLTIPPNTVKDENGNDYTGMLSISEVPAGFTPASLPDNLGPGMVFSIQPMGLTFAQPAPITFPNFDNLTPGSEVDIWSLNHTTGEFFIAGTGRVSPDGSVINTIAGGIVETSWHAPSPPPLELPAVAEDDPDHNENSDNPPNRCAGELASGYVIQTGNFFEDHTLPSYRSLSASRSLKFVYNSISAFPSPIITTQTGLAVNSAVPNVISTNLRVGGVNFDNETFKQATADQARQSSMFDAALVDTGYYFYSLETKSNYTSSTVSSSISGNVIVNNQINSPFGAGWTLDGLQRLYCLGRPDGKVLLTEGSGSAKKFSTNLTWAFSDLTTLSVNESPESITSGDFNGDDVLDLATANTTSNNVSILIGDGAGNFSAPTDFPVGMDPRFVSSGDFNGDNVLDLATANITSNNVSILIGDGAGNFSAPTNFIVGAAPHSIASGDFNGDNVLDLATANTTSNNVSILIGDGAGNFSALTNFIVGTAPLSIASGDFNGDNVLDLATANLSSNNVSILIGDGAGNFSAPTNFTVDTDPRSIVSGDFNGDNVLDLATANRTSNSMSILLGNGAGNFSAPTNFPVGTAPGFITSADFNGDNVPDLATVNSSSRDVSIFISDGVGSFFAPTTIPTGSITRAITTGDFNSDNVLDIAAINTDLSFTGLNMSILIGVTTKAKALPGDFSILAKNDDSTFTRTMKNGTQINFDAGGFHTSTVDRNGNTTTYTYDPDSLLTTITDPAGLVTTLNYQNSLLSSVTDPAGRITNFQHDNGGNLTKIIDPDGSESSYTYDPKHLMTTETDPNGNMHTINYSFAGRFQGMDFADGSTKQLSPSMQKGLVDSSSGVGDTVSNPEPNNVLADDINSTITDGNGNVSTAKTDNFGAITQSTDNCCLGRITEIERDEDGLPTMITKANGAITTNTYDNKGNLITSRDQSIGAFTTFTYDFKYNQVTSITDPNGNTTTINYDATGNPVEIVDAQSNTTAQTFNTQGQLTGVTDALGNTTTFTYDGNGNPETTTDPLGNVTTLITDSAGNVITTTDANGNVTQFVYDTLNRLTQLTDANGKITNYSYDSNGNLTQVTDANGNITTFAYDSMDRLVTNTDPLGHSDTFVYDGNGNLITTTDRNAQTVNFQYDSLNQLTTKTLPGNLVTSFNYDLVGNLTSITDPHSNLTFSYDGADRVLIAATTGSPNQPDVTIDYFYDENGNLQLIGDSLSGGASYVYDTLNRVVATTNQASQSLYFDYDKLNRRTLTTLSNLVMTDFAYDANSRLTSLQHKIDLFDLLGLRTFSGFNYTYDSVGNRTATNTTRTGVTANNSLNYVYDNIYQLTQATRPLPAQPDETFNYDPLGNRLQRDGQTVNSTIGQANRLLEDTEYTYSYDNNGNLIQKTDKATSETTDYIYDVENQLIRIDLPGGSVAQYRYDALGRRIEKNVDSVITRYVYSNEDILLEFDGTNTQIARYTHGLGIDEPLIMERGGQSFFYHTDGLGSIIDLTDINGAVAQSYVYDSFGNIEQQVGSMVNPYTYTGREFDSESGLYYYRARYYDSGMGRFINEDPIGFAGGDGNFYRYVQNNPVIFVDPSGLISLLDLGSAVLGLAGLSLATLTSPAWAPVVGGGLVVTAAVLQIYSTYETYKSIEDLSENEAIRKFKEHCKERDNDLRELDNLLKDQNNGF